LAALHLFQSAPPVPRGGNRLRPGAELVHRFVSIRPPGPPRGKPSHRPPPPHDSSPSFNPPPRSPEGQTRPPGGSRRLGRTFTPPPRSPEGETGQAGDLVDAADAVSIRPPGPPRGKRRPCKLVPFHGLHRGFRVPPFAIPLRATASPRQTSQVR